MNIDLFVDNDFIEIRNRHDIEALSEMEKQHRDSIYSESDNDIKTEFYKLDAKIYNETVRISYIYTSDMLKKLFKELGLDISITSA